MHVHYVKVYSNINIKNDQYPDSSINIDIPSKHEHITQRLKILHYIGSVLFLVELDYNKFQPVVYPDQFQDICTADLDMISLSAPPNLKSTFKQLPVVRG